jgi:hypothetical protein
MPRTFAFALACFIALPIAAESAPRKQRPAPERASSNQPAQEQDEFRSCDVAVRDFVQGQKQATALPVKEVKVHGLRMTLNFIHPYGESGDTPPNLAFTRGETVEERRSALNEVKQRIRTLAEAVKSGAVWYVIALRKGNADGLEGRRSPASAQPDESRPSASAVVMASIENRCITVSQYDAIPLDSLGEELRRILGERGREASPADNPTVPPPS